MYHANIHPPARPCTPIPCSIHILRYSYHPLFSSGVGSLMSKLRTTFGKFGEFLAQIAYFWLA